MEITTVQTRAADGTIVEVSRVGINDDLKLAILNRRKRILAYNTIVFFLMSLGGIGFGIYAFLNEWGFWYTSIIWLVFCVIATIGCGRSYRSTGAEIKQIENRRNAQGTTNSAMETDPVENVVSAQNPPKYTPN